MKSTTDIMFVDFYLGEKMKKLLSYKGFYGILLVLLAIGSVSLYTANSVLGVVLSVASILISIAGCLLIFVDFNDKGKYKFNFLLSKKGEIFSVLLVVFIAVMLRFVKLTSVPDGMMSDEWSMLYESWSLANYGIDRNGNSWPVYFVAWGSGQNALLTYLTIPFVQLFGINSFSASIVMAVSSVLTIITSYFLVKKITNKEIAFITIILLTILPWNLMLARWGLESNLLPCFLVLGVLFLVKSLKDNHWLFVLSCFFFGISLYSYALDFVFLPIFLIVCYITMIIKKKINWKSFVVGNIILAFLALPLILFVLVNFNILEPFKIFNVFTVPRLVGIRPGADGSFNIFMNLSNFFKIFFIQNDYLGWNTIEPFGFTFFLSVPFTIIGFVDICLNIKNDYKNNFEKFLMTVWLFSGIVSSFLMSASSLNHFNCLMIPYFYIIAQGIMISAQNSKTFYIIIFALYILMFAMFSSVYFSNNRQKQTHVMYPRFV